MKGLIFLHYYGGGPSSIRPSIMSLTCERSARYYENLLVGSHDSVDRVHAQGWLGDLLLGHQRSVKIFDFHLHVAKQCRCHTVGPGATIQWEKVSGLSAAKRDKESTRERICFQIRNMADGVLQRRPRNGGLIRARKIRVDFRIHPFRTHTPNIPYA